MIQLELTVGTDWSMLPRARSSLCFFDGHNNNDVHGQPRLEADAAAASQDTRDRFFSWMVLDPRSGSLVLGYYRVEGRDRLTSRRRRSRANRRRRSPRDVR